MATLPMTRARTAPSRNRSGVPGDVRSVSARLILAALVLWGVFCAAGWLLTRPLRDSGFERWDGSVNRWFAEHRTGTWNTVTHWLTYGAETTTVVAVGVLFFVVLRLRLHRWRESLFLAVALAGEVTIFVATTFVIDRDRPSVKHLDAAPPTSSFPSGHTAAATTLYGALAIVAVLTSRRVWLRTVAVALAVVMPLAVAFARLYRGMHYPTDVTGGALLGALWLTVTSAVILHRRAAAP